MNVKKNKFWDPKPEFNLGLKIAKGSWLLTFANTQQSCWLSRNKTVKEKLALYQLAVFCWKTYLPSLFNRRGNTESLSKNYCKTTSQTFGNLFVIFSCNGFLWGSFLRQYSVRCSAPVTTLDKILSNLDNFVCTLTHYSNVKKWPQMA